MKTIRNLTLIALFFGGLMSCKKEVNAPILNVKFSIEKATEYKHADLSFSQLFLFGINEENDEFKSNLEQMDKTISSDFVLSNSSTQSITTQDHFEMEVVALKAEAQLYLHETVGDGIVHVWDKVGDGKITLSHPVILESNGVYDVLLTMNIDEAIVEKEGSLAIDWNKVSAQIIQQ